LVAGPQAEPAARGVFRHRVDDLGWNRQAEPDIYRCPHACRRRNLGE
jgi:hypothetical protein